VDLWRVVLDTNVLVSALINSFGAPGRVLDLTLAGELQAFYDDRVLTEWRDVLRRERFGFAPTDVRALLEFFEHEGTKVRPSVLAVELPDSADVPFLEVATVAEAVLITGNLRHYPPEARCGVEVVDARTFLDQWATNLREGSE
jgi:putative PIN family toxin of toxin-antitoxin system